MDHELNVVDSDSASVGALRDYSGVGDVTLDCLEQVARIATVYHLIIAIGDSVGLNRDLTSRASAGRQLHIRYFQGQNLASLVCIGGCKYISEEHTIGGGKATAGYVTSYSQGGYDGALAW